MSLVEQEREDAFDVKTEKLFARISRELNLVNLLSRLAAIIEKLEFFLLVRQFLSSF